MNSVLPEIIDAPEPVDDVEINENSGDEDEDQENLDKLELEVEEIVEVKEKVKIDNEKIFQDLPPPEVKPVVKKKRVMSEARLKQLADARAKSIATRKAKKEKEMKEKQDAKALAKKQAEEIIEEKKNQYIDRKVKKYTKSIDKDPVIVQQSNISLEDIENITASAINKYDLQRQQRKEEKRKKREEDMKHKAINEKIRQAQGRSKGLTPQDEGFFDSCF